MSPNLILLIVTAYSALLFLVVWITSRNADNESYFIGNKSSRWYLVAYGMIGASLSGVTFMSVPGAVATTQFSYMQVVFGYLIGYAVIALILMPVYYKMNLTSIYTYLGKRFNVEAHKIGSIFFIISRAIGATARLYLVVNVLQIFLLEGLGVPFWVTSLVLLLMVLLYTFEGGVKTIIYTDTLQTTGMLLGLVVCIIVILNNMNLDFSNALSLLNKKGYSNIFNTDYKAGSFYLKHIIGGAFIAISMTGLDQEMMQKNISVKTLEGSQKNVLTLATVLLIVNLLFLFLGGLLSLYATQQGLDVKGDDLFPTIALSGTLSAAIGVIFIIGLISALFPSADGALTAMTSSFCIDILGMQKDTLTSDKDKKRTRLMVHLGFAVLFFCCVVMFKWINDKSIIDVILKLAGYTYGPLLGMFAFGIFTHRVPKDKWVLWVCLLSPIFIFGLDFINNAEWFAKKLALSESTSTSLIQLSDSIFSGFKIGIEMLILNGLVTFMGLWMISKKQK